MPTRRGSARMVRGSGLNHRDTETRRRQEEQEPFPLSSPCLGVSVVPPLPAYFLNSAVISASVSLSLPLDSSITSAVPLGAIHTRWLPSWKTFFSSGCF